MSHERSAYEPTTYEVVKLEGFEDIPVLRPGLRFYLDLIERGRFFALVKRTHGFWDRLVDLVEVVPALGRKVRSAVEDPALRLQSLSWFRDLELTEAQIEDLESRRPFKTFWKDHYLADLIHDLQNPHPDPGYLESNTFRGYANAVHKPAIHEAWQLREVFLAVHTSGRVFHDALVFKDAVMSGELYQVFDAIRPLTVVMVGPPHLSTLGEILGLPDFHHVRIHPTNAFADRAEILEACRAYLRDEPHGSRPKAFLWQAGSLAWWLTYRLFPETRNTYFLDFGRPLDVWYPDVVSRQPWFQYNREHIVRQMRLGEIHS